jgi:cell division transport system permease protein
MTLKKLNLTKFLILIKNGFLLFKRNIAINITSIITIITALYIFFIFFVLSYSVDLFFGKLVNIQNIRAYTTTNADLKKVNSLIGDLKRLRSIKDVKFYSSKDSYKYLKESYMSEKYLELLPEEFFPSFLEITLKDNYREIRYVKEVEAELAKYDIIDVTSFGEKWLLNFLSIKVGLKIFVMILTFLLSISIGSVIYNTINLKLFKFKDEIKIYSLVGATRSFITVPYIVASIIETIISFFVAFVLQVITFALIKQFFLDRLGISFLQSPSFSIILSIFIIIVLISAISALLSVLSFLDRNLGAIGE